MAPTGSPTDSPKTSPPTSPIGEPTSSPSAAKESPTTMSPSEHSEDSRVDLFPYRLRTKRGSQSTDQEISVLQSLHLSGTENDWDTYIELGREGPSNAYRGILAFSVPSVIDLNMYRRARLTVNYYGPNDGRWQFQAKMRANGQWRWQTVGVADIDTVQSWVWTKVEFELFDADMENMQSILGDDIKIRIRTIAENDDVVDIDYLKLTFQ